MWVCIVTVPTIHGKPGIARCCGLLAVAIPIGIKKQAREDKTIVGLIYQAVTVIIDPVAELWCARKYRFVLVVTVAIVEGHPIRVSVCEHPACLFVCLGSDQTALKKRQQTAPAHSPSPSILSGR